MKKWLLMVVAAVFCAWNVQAQTEKGAMAAGVNLTVGFGDSYTNVGLGAKYQYNIIDNLRLEPNFNYYFKKDYLSMWDLSVNVHYLFTLYEGLNFYPLAGIGVAGGKAHYGSAADDWYGEGLGGLIEDVLDEYEVDDTLTNFIFNIGAGLEYMITDNISVNLEYKYRVCADLNRSLLSFGVAYHF